MSKSETAIWVLAIALSGLACGFCFGLCAGYDHGSVDAWNAAADTLDKWAEKNQLVGVPKLTRLKYRW